MSSVDRRKFIKTTAAAGLASLPALQTAQALSARAGLLGVQPELAPPRPLSPADYTVHAVPQSAVKITDAFWTPRIEANRAVSIHHCFERIGNGDFGTSKLVEGAAHMLAQRPDPELAAYVDKRIDDILAGLERRVPGPEQSVRVSGHFLEAAVAYKQLTGKRKMFDAALRYADQMDQVYGPGKASYISEHEGLKIGLLSLYRETGDERYWRLAKFFADERGKEDYPRKGEYAKDRTYAQDYARVVDQKEALGHCVRATFLYIPMVDIAALAGSKPYRSAVEQIWRDAVTHKTYLTGGIGSIRFHEQFGADHELPNLSSWNETCAAYGNVVWNHRMFLLERDAQYIDVMERVLYNALNVGVSLKGDRFFYQNPLKSFGDYERFEWINTPCCPPNVVRMMASLGTYIYATDAARDLYVNLFVDSDTSVSMNGTAVKVQQRTRYPWDGAVRVQVDPAAPAAFALHVRIPGWSRDAVMPGDLYKFVNGPPPDGSATLRINGQAQKITLEKGYARIERTWQPGDVVELSIPMPVRQIVTHPAVEEDRGLVALQRGPLVYCAEWPDNGGRALNIVVPEHAALDSEFRPDLLGGVQVIRGRVQAIARDGDDAPIHTVDHELTAIPYYAWANRGMGEMAVWLARAPKQAWLPPVLPANVARVTHFGGVQKGWTGYNDQNDDLGAVYDGWQPLNSADQSHRFFRLRSPVGEPAWIQYDFKAPTKISSARVFWFDDKRFCKIPSSWRILYQENGEWKPVQGANYPVIKDAFNVARFTPVTATAVRLEVEPQTVQYHAGEVGPPAAMFINEDVAWRESGVIEWAVV